VLRCVSGGARVAGSGVVCGMGGFGSAVDCGGGLWCGLRLDGCEIGGCGGAQVRRWDGWMRQCGDEEDAAAANAAWFGVAVREKGIRKKGNILVACAGWGVGGPCVGGSGLGRSGPDVVLGPIYQWQ
jgi:hypothetical protein